MAEVKWTVFAFLLVLFIPGTTLANTTQAGAFASWLEGIEQDAIAAGIAPETAHSVLYNAALDDRVVDLDQSQPETTITFDTYIKHVVTPERIAAGKRAMHENAALLKEVSARYGVPPEIIVALWGVESSFGRNSGDYNVIDSLVTLAYEGRRPGFFRDELINALQIIDREHISQDKLRGSWAGAMGQCQFMPSTYLHYAASYGNHSPDIWDNSGDVFASIANYILADGWNVDQTWGYEVSLEYEISEDQLGINHKKTLAEWDDMGIRDVVGGRIPRAPLNAALIAPDGPEGRHFLVYDNFRALLRWNHSTFFAASVGLLADQIR